MVVNHDVTRILRGASSVDVPSDGTVADFIEEIKAKGWDELNDARGDLTIWRLNTPRSSKEIEKKGYLAKLDFLGEEDEDEDEEGEEEEKEVVSFLGPDYDISSYLKEPLSGNRIRVLVQPPAPAKSTSCCAVSIGYISNKIKVAMHTTRMVNTSYISLPQPSLSD